MRKLNSVVSSIVLASSAAWVVATIASCSAGDPDFIEPLGLSREAILSAPNALGPGQWLNRGESLVSKNGLYSLVCQTDGNLAVYRNAGSIVLWSSNSAAVGGPSPLDQCTMQTDGNLVLYRKTAQGTYISTFSSMTGGNANARLTLQDDGIAAIFGVDGHELWSTRPPVGGLKSGQMLMPYQPLRSLNGRYQLLLQGDGNLVLTRVDTAAALWSTQTGGASVAWLLVQPDGNVVLSNTNGTAAWSSGTHANAGAHLVLQDDGDLVVFRQNGTVAWRSNTAHPPGRFIFAHAGTGVEGQAGIGGPASAMKFSRPGGITGNSTGAMFVLDSGNNRVVRIAPNGSTSLFDGSTASRNSRNLLLNPGGEDWWEDGRPVSGWIDPSLDPEDPIWQSAWQVRSATGACTPPACLWDPFEGALMISAEGQRSTDSALQQMLDLDFTSEIDQGVAEVAFTGYVHSVETSTPSAARITVDYLNANNVSVNSLANFDSGPILSLSGWRRVYHTRVLPPGTRRARVRLLAIRAPGQSFTSTQFDGLSFIRQGSNGLNNPQGIVNEGGTSESVIIADTYNHRVVRIAQAGAQPEVLAGTGVPGTGSNMLNCPKGLARALNGDIFIADYGSHRVMRLRNGALSVVSGTGVPGWALPGNPAAGADLTYPTAVAVASNGYLFFAEKKFSQVRYVDGDGILRAFVGNANLGVSGYGGDGGPAVGAMINQPDGLAFERDGSLLISDSGNHAVRRVKDGIITTAFRGPVARTSNGYIDWNALSGNSGDGGAADAAMFDWPVGLYVNPLTSDVYVADQQNHRIRVVGCSDRNVCNGTESYLLPSGSCQSTSPVNVNDGNACTTDSCDPTTGAVSHVATPLSDGDDCTLDSCITTSGIRHTARAAGSACDDGAASTQNDVCMAGSAVCRGTPIP
jgi:hypothetical protein